MIYLDYSANTPVDPAEIIYTSGASESNNLAIKGIVQAARHMGGHIISTALEHSSAVGTLSDLQCMKNRETWREEP